MTTLQDTAVGPASQNELISPARLLLLAPTEPRAPIAILSPAKRTALIACFNAGGLHKKDGAWHGPPGGKPVSGDRAYRGFQKKFGPATDAFLCDQHRRIVAYSVPNWRNFVH
jgi:hypothetical protein